MKKMLVISLVLAALSGSCGKGTGEGELTGVKGRPKPFEPDPFGMVFIPQGSFNMGPSDQDVSWAQNITSKTVSVDAFWMDESEMTNNKYRQFVYWVEDSIMRRMLGESQEDFLIKEDENGNPIDPPMINWSTKIDLKDEETNEILKEI